MRIQVRRRASPSPRSAALLELLAATLDAADPETITASGLRELGISGPVSVIAIGKAAAAMSRGAAEALGPAVREAVVVADAAAPVPQGWQLAIGGHPEPNEDSVAAGSLVAGVAVRADELLVLVSGGASALVELPAGGLMPADLAATTRVLLDGGVPIEELNIVRRHLSELKGGRLGMLAQPARLTTLVISDVVGDDVSTIGSGPTVGDASSFADALQIATRFAEALPGRVLDHLAAGAAGDVPDTPDEVAGEVRVLSNGSEVAGLAVRLAASRGLPVIGIRGPLVGDAATAARRVLDGASAGLTVWHGETTVDVVGDAPGGRNQHAALAAALEIDGDAERVFLACGTDGIDGRTDAAGALVDGATVQRGRVLGMDAAGHLERFDAHRYVVRTGDAVYTGRTGVNVADLWFSWT